MKKILKSRIFFLILGVIIATVVGVSASILYQADQVGFTPTNPNWNVSNLEDALNDLYSKKETESNATKFCTFVTSEYGDSSNHLSVGSKYSCDPGDGTKRNFFVLAVDNNKVKLIMEHNITEGSGTTTMTWMNGMKYFRTGAGSSIKTAWENVQDVDLPLAQDIANAVGNSGWNMEDKNYDGWFYFDKNGSSYGQTQVANSLNLSAYKWLYNYTRECSSYGCNSEASLGSTEAYGYWTRDIVAQQKDSTGRAWRVSRRGNLNYGPVSTSTDDGIRPVITVLKDNLQG